MWKPKWFWFFPFAHSLSPIYDIFATIAIIGLTAIAIGWGTALVIAGAILALPYLLLVFLLWVSVRDDGYLRDKESQEK